jgi:FMN phosphatase YigB (HAD superfamily)
VTPAVRARLERPHTVTFDCWATLLYQVGPGATEERARQLAGRVGTDPAATAIALAKAWREHQLAWHRRRAFGAPEMIAHALGALGVAAPPSRVASLVAELEPAILALDVRAVDGARDALAALASAGVRRALVCDTGFSSGRVVRQLLARQGLLELLEVTVFSDEIGVPKPHPRAFAAALDGLGVPAAGAVHVGDLKRSDVAGARRAGMGSVRLTARNDDAGTGAGAGVIDCAAAGCEPVCERPEADAVVGSYAELLDVLGHGSR